MDVFEAAYRVAHDFPGGATALAARMGKNPGTLMNELNPSQEGHKLGVGDATAMQAISGDHRILHAMAHTLGEVCFRVPDLHRVSDDALLEHINAIGVEAGQFHAAIRQALQYRKFTREDYKHVRQEAMDYIAAIAEALGRMEGMIDED